MRHLLCCSGFGVWQYAFTRSAKTAQALGDKLREAVDIIRKDAAVDTVVGFSGGSAVPLRLARCAQ